MPSGNISSLQQKSNSRVYTWFITRVGDNYQLTPSRWCVRVNKLNAPRVSVRPVPRAWSELARRYETALRDKRSRLFRRVTIDSSRPTRSTFPSCTPLRRSRRRTASYTGSTIGYHAVSRRLPCLFRWRKRCNSTPRVSALGQRLWTPRWVRLSRRRTNREPNIYRRATPKQ